VRRLAALAVVLGMAMPVMASPYVPGSIQPSVGQSEIDGQLQAFYRSWKSVYLAHGCGADRAYVDVAGDGKPVYGGTEAHTITVSEAHGYGMLILVMMADMDPDAHADFDAMVRYFHDHPATSSPHLLAWNQVEGCANAGEEVGGANTATDGDLDIAYALLLADRKWGSAGAFDYGAEARATIDAIMAFEVAPGSQHLLIGDWAGRDEDTTYRNTTRSSDFMTSHLRAFADASGNRDWLAVRDRTYDIMATILAGPSAATGLMPDFIVDADAQAKPAPALWLEGEADGFYSWNAGRYPWRIALDWLLYGEPRAKVDLAPLTAWLRKATSDDPTRIADTYRLDGSVLPDHGDNPMLYVAPIGVAAMLDPANQQWLDAIWDDVTTTGIADEDYFGNTVKLLAMIAMSGHWQKP